MEKKYKSTQLQFLRFCSFFLIFLFHTGEYQFWWFPQGNGAANAVSFFMILSGTVSAISTYEKKVVVSLKSISEYLWKKLVKIYPLYFVTTLITIAYSPIPQLLANCSFQQLIIPFKQLAKNLFLIQSWFPYDYFEYNGVGWFLSTILFLYAISIPLKSIANRIREKNNLLFIYIFTFAVGLVFIYCYLTRNTNMEYSQYVFPISRIGEYVCGLCIGYLAIPTFNRVCENKTNKVLFSILEIIAFIFWIANMYIPMEIWHFRIIHWLLPNCLLILVFSIGKGFLSAFFRIDILRYLGDISFECFLLHQVVISIYNRCSGMYAISRLGNLFSIGFCAIITIMLSALFAKKNIRINK